ncbi:MAG: ABC transporter ATP-binding protein [Lachnospiraceae bacterium]|nr:ABC transporter ATP-binding protein [Lachnospiraceae bacterium]
MEIIRLENVSKIYGSGEGEVRALDNLSLSINKGSITSIMGASGSGKSTLLHLMGGVDVPTEGKVYVEGQEISKFSDEQLSILRRRKVGFVFQSYHLMPVLNVEENIVLPILLDHRKPDWEYVDQLIKRLDMEDKRKSLPNQLSGGQQQRVAIGRALANKPSILLADEPTGALDSKNGIEILELLKWSVKELGQTLVMITHNPEVAACAERIVRLSDGRIISDSEESGEEA